jgi:hypothetical protein
MLRPQYYHWHGWTSTYTNVVLTTRVAGYMYAGFSSVAACLAVWFEKTVLAAVMMDGELAA